MNRPHVRQNIFEIVYFGIMLLLMLFLFIMSVINNINTQFLPRNLVISTSFLGIIAFLFIFCYEVLNG